MNSRHCIGLLIAAAAVGAGCSGDPEPAAAVVPSVAVQPAVPALAEETGAPPVPGEEAGVAAVNPVAALRAAEPEDTGNVTPEPPQAHLDVLQEVIDSFVSQTGRTPAGFEELVNGRFMSRLPQAPAGKRFVIDPKTAQLSLANL